jgi:hypothetical protein
VSTIDRSYRTGVRYLFVPVREGGDFLDNACTATVVYSGEVARNAPATVRLPRRSATGSSGVAVQAAIALAVVGAGLVVTIVAKRRGRRVNPS